MAFSKFFIFINYPTVVILFCLTFFFMHDHTFPPKIIRQFLMLIGCLTGLLLVDNGYAYFSTYSTYSTGKLIFTCLGYIFRPLCLSAIITITMRQTQKKAINYFLPTIFISLVAVLNLFFPVIFYIDQNNQFHRYYFFWLPYATNLAMFIQVLVYNAKFIRINFRETVFLTSYMVAILIVSALDAFEMCYAIIPCAASVGTLFYFINLNIDMYKRDTLTKLYGRESFEFDCKKFSRYSTVIVSMDLNNLKKWNDDYGHNEGDNAILAAVKAMNSNLAPIGIVYRTGGDEFMALFPKKTIAEVAQAISKFQKEISLTKYQVAVGFAMHTPGSSFEEAISISDVRMYQNKKLIKASEHLQ